MMCVRGQYKTANTNFGTRDERMTRDKLKLVGLYHLRKAMQNLKDGSIEALSFVTESLEDAIAGAQPQI